MISNTIKKKGILNKLLEQAIRILLIKECKKISNIKIDIISSTMDTIIEHVVDMATYASM